MIFVSVILLCSTLILLNSRLEITFFFILTVKFPFLFSDLCWGPGILKILKPSSHWTEPSDITLKMCILSAPCIYAFHVFPTSNNLNLPIPPSPITFVMEARCILLRGANRSFVSNVEFTHQQMHFFYFKKYIKIYTKIHINIAPTCFGLLPSSGSLHWTWLKLYLC